MSLNLQNYSRVYLDLRVGKKPVEALALIFQEFYSHKDHQYES